ncbi:MAG: hypothetical protein V2I46_04230 [Bacteroides sp.]|jgi:beta-phosphoglucomutase-like phosphatase (HAD superfamily)|nr:hypothetical protein [Bacteroides sp.]
MLKNAKYIVEKVNSMRGTFAVVKNPGYVFPAEEYYLLASPLKKVKDINAVLMDMDGTTTTTEVLCIHSLEQMVRRMSGKIKREDWIGLNPSADFPHIIGNSTTRHIEYLINKYESLLDDKQIEIAFLEAALWTLKYGNDPNRKLEVIQNLRKTGLERAVEDLTSAKEPDEVIRKFAGKLNTSGFMNRVNIGIDIYYEIYHRILSRLNNGEGVKVKKEIFGDSGEYGQVISPMPGIHVLIPLLKGWLGEEAVVFAEYLKKELELKIGRKSKKKDISEIENSLRILGEKFENKPSKLGLVTSSIRYEADIVIHEVFGIIRDFIEQSLLSDTRKKAIVQKLQDPNNVYDAFITASNSSEIRLKPHRDLYSIALHQANILPEDFGKVIGFEDSQSGTIAIRAAGIGCCVAVPFAETSEHDLEAAVHILPGGIPQALIEYNLFLKD